MGGRLGGLASVTDPAVSETTTPATEAKEAKLRVAASRAVRKMSAFQRRGMATSLLAMMTSASAADSGGARTGCAMSGPQLLEENKGAHLHAEREEAIDGAP